MLTLAGTDESGGGLVIAEIVVETTDLVGRESLAIDLVLQT